MAVGREITATEVAALLHHLQCAGEIVFPVSLAISSFICGTVYGLKKRKSNRLRLKHRLVRRVSRTYRDLTKFILFVGVENIDIYDRFDPKELSKNELVVKVEDGAEIAWEDLRNAVSSEFRG